MKIRLSAALRVLGFVLGGLFALVAALALVIWIGFDAEGTTTMLTHHFKERYQRTLLLREAPQLRIWPRPSLLLRHASLSEKGSIDSFIEVDRIRLDLSALSLVLRQPSVTRLNFDGVHMNLRRLPSSEWNISGFWDEPLIEPSPLPWSLKPDRIIVHGLALQVVGAQEDKPIRMTVPSLEFSDLNSRGPGIVHFLGRFQAEGTDVTVQGQSRFVVGKRLEAGSLKDIRLNLKSTGGQVKDGVAELENASLNWSDSGKSGQFGPVSLKAHGILAGQTFQMALSSQELGWKNWQLLGNKVSVAATLEDTRGKTSLKLSLPQLQGVQNGFETRNFSVSWEARHGERGSEGTLSGRLGADILAEHYVLDTVQASVQMHHPVFRNGLLPVNAMGGFRWSRADGLQGNLQAVSGENEVQLQPDLRTLWPLAGQLNFRGKGVDVDALLASPLLRSDWHSLLMGWPAQTDLQGQIQLNRLRLGGVLLNDLTLPYAVRDIGVRIPVFSASVAGGRIRGEFESVVAQQQIQSSGEFSGIEVDRMFGDAGVSMPLSGKATGSFRLSTLVSPTADPLRQLEGAVRWSMPEARWQGVDLMRSLHALNRSILAREPAVHRPVQGEHTRLGRASSRFVFAGGMIQAENVQTHNEWLTLTGSGRIGLINDGLELNVHAALLPGVAKTAARDLVKLRSRPVKLLLKGSSLHPEVRYEPESGKEPAQRAVGG